MNARTLSLFFILCVVWGFHFVVIKVAVTEIPPMFYAAVRMTLVALLLSPFLRWRRGSMLYIFIAGLCLGAVNYALMFSGVKMATASAAAIAIELYVPFATILSIMFLGDKPGWRRLTGIAFAFAGVAIIATGDTSGSVSGERMGVGIGLVALGAFCEAVGAVFVKRLKGFKAHEMLAWFAVIGSIGLWGMTAVFEVGQRDAWAVSNQTLVIGAILYSAVLASIFGHTTYYWLLQRLPLSVVAPSVLLSTFFAVIFSILLLGDPFGPRMIIGGLMTVAGVGFVLLRNVKKQDDNAVLVDPPG